MNLRNLLAKHYSNYRGWSTNRKIVVFESDDWGSIRMPSLDSVNFLIDKGYPLHNNPFTLIDGLERKTDLEELFNILKSFRDFKGNFPVITACSLVANPDFKKIRESNFTKYYYEKIDETYTNYGEQNLLDFWKFEGIRNNLLFPQFHGREHLNPDKWLRVLKSNNSMELDAFNSNALLGLSGASTESKNLYMAAFEAYEEKEKEKVKDTVRDGLKIFKEVFGFTPISYIPSQSKQFEEINETLINEGVFFSQSGQYLLPIENGKFKKVEKFWGSKDKFGITYWRRNCNFEPYKGYKTEVDKCLYEIGIAFKYGKPAVISTHRINFTSRINAENRDYCLEQFKLLLSLVISKYPDVEFLNSSQLAEIIKTNSNE